MPSSQSPGDSLELYGLDNDEALKNPSATTLRALKTPPNMQDVLPVIILVCKTIQDLPTMTTFKVLLDSGSTMCLIHERCLPSGTVPFQDRFSSVTTTAQGSFDTSKYVFISNIRLPEFGNGKYTRGINARLFSAPCKYDMILGRDFLLMTGIDLFYSSRTIRWLGSTIDMKPTDHFDNPQNVAEAMWIAEDDELLDGGFIEFHLTPNCQPTNCRRASDSGLNSSLAADAATKRPIEATKILDAQYQRVTPKQVADQQEHMNSSERQNVSQTPGVV